MKDFIIKMVSRNGGISSKRVCGVLGWMVCLFVSLYCSLNSLSIPSFLTTVAITSAALLGVESITNIFKNE